MQELRWPLGKGRLVVQETGVCGGVPTTYPGRVPTKAVLDLCLAEQGNVAAVAAWYGITEDEVRDAVAYESDCCQSCGMSFDVYRRAETAGVRVVGVSSPACVKCDILDQTPFAIQLAAEKHAREMDALNDMREKFAVRLEDLTPNPSSAP